MRRSTRVLCALVGVVLIGCGRSSGSGVESNTPRLHPRAKELERGLLTTAAVNTIPGLEDLREQAPQQTAAFENPDPRGPCGAKVRAPDLNQGAMRAWARRDLTVIEIVLRPGTTRARNYLDATLADSMIGCAAFDSKTNTGATQRVTPTMVNLPSVGDQRTAFRAAVDTQGQRAYSAEVLVRRGDLLVLVQPIAFGPITDATLRALAIQADTAAQRLAPCVV